MQKSSIKNIDKIMTILKNEVKQFENPVATEIGEKTRSPFMVLVSCLLSLRTMDKITGPVSKKLFEVADTPQKINELSLKRLKKIKNKIQAISKQKYPITPNKIEKFSKIEEVNDFKEVTLKSKYKKYETCELPQKSITLQFDSYGDLRSYYHSNDLKQRLLKVIEAEGPIEKEFLFKRVLDSVGIQKLGNRIENLFEGFLKELKEDRGIHINQKTVALNKINVTSPVRISTEEQRPFVLIPKEELGSAIVDILRTHFSISKDALITDIAREIYNNQRTGNKIEAKMGITIKYLLANRLIEEKNGKIQMIKTER